MTNTEWASVKELTERLDDLEREKNDIRSKLEAIRSILDNSNSSKSSYRGPLPQKTHEERIKKIISCMKSKGGKDISVNVIASFIGITKGAVLNYMTRRLSHSDCLWKQGKLATWFTLKELE